MAVNLEPMARNALRTAEREGYVGETVSERGISSGYRSDLCCCLCLSTSGRRGEKQGIVISVILFAMSFFVGLYYTANSARSTLSHQHMIGKIRQIEKQIVVRCDNSQMSTPSAPPHDVMILQDIETIYRGMRNERAAACFSQTLMTAGAGLLTVALLITFIYEGQFAMQNYFIAGGCAVAGGLAAYTIKYIALRFENEKEAYNNLSLMYPNF
jgi:hypothetical protein